MSYILDALRKAEQERHLGQPPNPAALPPMQSASPRFWFRWMVGLGLAANLAALIFLLVQPRLGTPPPAVIPSPATIPTPAQAPATEAPLAAPEPVGKPTLPPPPPVEWVGKTTPPATSSREPVGPATPPPPPRPAMPAGREQGPATPPGINRAGNTAPESRERHPKPPPKPVPGPSVTLGPEPPPFLETLPPNARRGLPDLNLDLHAYSSDADKRFVVVNGRRYREGESLGSGLVLEAVTANGAILRQGSQRFQLSVRR